MEGLHTHIHPRVVPWSPGKPLDPVIATLGTVSNRIAVSITGGCAQANMTYADGKETIDLFTQAFDGFAGVVLVGGTRMIVDDNPSNVLFGITEVGAAIRTHCNGSFVLSVVPRLQEVVFYQEASMLKVVHTIGEPGTPEHTTIVHPHQDIVVGIGKQLCPGRPLWDDEIEFRRYITETLRAYAQWRSVLVAYNGGQTTEREVRIIAQNGWPVILVRGSGRVTDALAKDETFLQAHPNVRVCEHSAASLRQELRGFGAITDDATSPRHLKLA